VRFTSARLDGRRPDGSPWHAKPADDAAAILGGLIGLAVGYPSVGLSIGQAADDPGGDPLAPAPFIDLKIEATTYRVSAVGTTYSPNWQQPIAIDARGYTGNEQVVVQIRDAVDDSVIAQHETTLAKLVSRPAQTFTDMGPVKTLDVVAKEAAPRKSIEYRISVPAHATLQVLLDGGAKGWAPIPVWNGDTVRIEATGAVCPSSPDECFGPDGAQEGRWKSYSYEGFKNARHASLVAVVPGGRYAFGAHGTIKIEQSGRVLLFVNDTDVGNNSGAFQVKVTVVPP
jgi:hypothetical protein